jgi:hypothetical protein
MVGGSVRRLDRVRRRRLSPVIGVAPPSGTGYFALRCRGAQATGCKAILQLRAWTLRTWLPSLRLRLTRES